MQIRAILTPKTGRLGALIDRLMADSFPSTLATFLFVHNHFDFVSTLNGIAFFPEEIEKRFFLLVIVLLELTLDFSTLHTTSQPSYLLKK